MTEDNNIEKPNSESLEHFLSFTLTVLSPIINTDVGVLNNPLSKKVTSALEFLIKYAGGKEKFRATRTKIADVNKIDKKTLGSHLKVLISWQEKNEIGLVGYRDNENTRDETDWELPILNVIEKIAERCPKDVDLSLFGAVRESFPSNPEGYEETHSELVKELIKDAQRQIQQLPPFPNKNRWARTKTTENNIERKEKSDSIKRGNEKAEQRKRELSEKNVEEANEIYQKNKESELVFRNRVTAEIQHYRLINGVEQIQTDSLDERVIEMENEIYQKIIELKLFFGETSSETKKHIESQFALYQRILTADLKLE